MSPSAKKVLVWAVGLAAVAFALMGGQYSTLDLLRQKSHTRDLEERIAVLRKEIDSLQAYRRSLATDPKVQERVAREQHGMSREGEIVYKFVR
jgi:cell division protein FtsB